MRNGSEPLVVTCHHGGMERNKENISPRRPPLGQAKIFIYPCCRLTSFSQNTSGFESFRFFQNWSDKTTCGFLVPKFLI